jgi:hypothetical protein
VVLVFGDLGLDGRDVPDLLTAGRAQRRQIRSEVVLAGRAAGGAQRYNAVHLLDRQEFTLLVGMTGLCAFVLRLATGSFYRRR